MEQIPQNLSNRERGVRIAIGLGLFGAFWAGGAESHLAIALFVFAWAPLVTGLTGWCPAYQLFGFSTRRR